MREMKKKECPNCHEMAVVITYDNPQTGTDTYECEACGWKG